LLYVLRSTQNTNKLYGQNVELFVTNGGTCSIYWGLKY